jgi:hypothetical protein
MTGSTGKGKREKGTRKKEKEMDNSKRKNGNENRTGEEWKTKGPAQKKRRPAP